ncbi:hypothetical protein BH09BAC6_BH09BAC6_11780 [soil metagenome]|jgi:hypothetical protein
MQDTPNTPNDTTRQPKKTWVAPVLIEEELKKTQGGAKFTGREVVTVNYNYHS